MPEIPSETNLQLEADMLDKIKTVTPNADIPEQARAQPKELLETKYVSIISKSATDIGRTNLLELDIPMKGPTITSKPYSVPHKYREFLHQEIKHLEEAGIISRNMSHWASPILVVPKKEKRAAPTVPKSSMNNHTKHKKKFSLRLCINYRKLNSHIVTARQIKLDGSIAKIKANYPLPTINNLLEKPTSTTF